MNSTKPMQNTPQSDPQDYELQLTKMMAYNLQLTRIVWQLVSLLGGKATIRPEEISMLWDLKRTPVQGQRGKELILEADLLPEIPEETIQQMAKELGGTQTDLLAIREKYNIGSYTPPYIELRLARYVRFIDGHWQNPGAPDPSVN